MNNMEIKSATAVPSSEFSLKFVQGMCDAMGVSFFKYGKASDAYPSKVDAVASAKDRLSLYESGGVVKGKKVQPGNIWYLVDAANFLMIESMYPRRAGATWGSNESDDSPGRRFQDGVSERDNRGRSQSDNATDGVADLADRRYNPAPSFYKRSGD